MLILFEKACRTPWEIVDIVVASVFSAYAVDDVFITVNFNVDIVEVMKGVRQLPNFHFLLCETSLHILLKM